MARLDTDPIVPKLDQYSILQALGEDLDFWDFLTILDRVVKQVVNYVGQCSLSARIIGCLASRSQLILPFLLDRDKERFWIAFFMI